MNKPTKITITTLALALISLAASYGLEILTFALDDMLDTPAELLGALILGAVLIVLVFVVFALINKKAKWLEAKESALAMWLGATLYVLLMIFVFGRIPVPYELIPREEMAFGLWQVLMQMFHCGGAGACWLFGCVRFFYLKFGKK